jgi:hypothetical protein
MCKEKMNWYCPTSDDTIVFFWVLSLWNYIAHLHRVYVSLVGGGTNAMNIGWPLRFNSSGWWYMTCLLLFFCFPFSEVTFLYENYHSNHPNKYDLNGSLNMFLIVLWPNYKSALIFFHFCKLQTSTYVVSRLGKISPNYNKIKKSCGQMFS